MQRFLPSLWLLAAALYATVALFLEHALNEKALMAQVAAHETVRAKQPARALDLKAGHAAPQRMVQVASFTTVVHARPSSSSPVISAYPIGQELRVMARESGFARVQDLGSGHLGWITEAALVPRMRGYRLREQMPAEPQIVAAAEPLPPPLAESAAPHVKAAATVVPRKVAPPSPRASRPPIAESAETPAEGGFGLGLFRRRDQAQLIPARARSGELAGFLQRAISGR